MSSTLSFAILGLLAKHPSTGYEISRAMQRPVGYFWTAGHSQIYPELAALEKAGSVRSAVIAGRGPRDTKRYTITAGGRSVLTGWLSSPLPEDNPKNELMLRVWSLWLLSPDRATALIQEVRDRQYAALAIYAFEEEQFLQDEPGMHEPGDAAFGEYATLRWGIGQRRAMIEWCEWLLAQLQTG